MNIRHSITALLLTLLTLWHTDAAAWEAPRESAFATDNTDAATATATEGMPDSPQGLWSFPDEASEVAIVPISDTMSDVYKIVLLYDADLLPPPGTVIGYLAPTASTSKWRVWIYTDVKDNTLSNPREYAATFTVATDGSDASLVLERKKLSVRFNPAAMLPFLRRVFSIKTDSDKASRLPYGLRRIQSARRLRYL